MSVGEETQAAEPDQTQDIEGQLGPQPEPEQQVETVTGDQEGADEAEGDESSATAEAERDWRQDPDVLDFAQSAGIPAGELEDYTDRYELERTVRVADRRYIADLARQAQAAEQEPPPEPTQTRTPPAEPAFQQPVALQAIDRELIEGPIADALEARDKHHGANYSAMREEFTVLASQFEEVIAGLQHQANERELQAFHETIDGLGHDDLFGKLDGLQSGSEHDQNRQRAWNAYIYVENPQRTPSKALVQRAINQEFWSELKKEERRKFRRRLQRQRDRVLPGRGRTGASTETQEESGGGGISDQSKEDLVRRYGKMTG